MVKEIMNKPASRFTNQVSMDAALARRLVRNRWFALGLIVLIGGSGPLIIGGVLHELGVVNIGNGLGFGLLFFVSWPIAALLMYLGWARVVTNSSPDRRDSAPDR